jgi:hypothetical protein
MIRAAILAVAAIATSFPWSAQPVKAREAPWCAVIGMTDEQCRSVIVSGNRGWCNPSPYATPQATEPKRKARKGHSS